MKKLRSDRKLTPHMTLKKAAEVLGMEGPNVAQQLRRRLLALEARTGRTFMVRNGLGGTRVRYMVTLSLLREHCPELFNTREETIETMREHLNRYDDMFFETNRKINDLCSKFRSFVSETRASIASLSRR